MIDIHNHGIYGVDDGADTIETSLAMLEAAREQGITDIIYTPHYRHGMFETPVEVIEEHFHKIEEALEGRCKAGSGPYINVALGCEYHVDSEIIDHLRSGRVHSLADSSYVLTEYSHDTPEKSIRLFTDELLAAGYIPVIAHVERYGVFQKNPDLAGNLEDMGAMIQVNADSVLGLEGHVLKKTVKRLLDLDVVDYVASDAHGTKERANHLSKAQDRIAKKYGSDRAILLTKELPKNILK